MSLIDTIENGTYSDVREILGESDDVRRLLEEENDEWYTPLMIAVMNGRHRIVELLLEEGKRLGIMDEMVNHKSRDWSTPVLVAALNNDPEMLELLGSYGADMDSVTLLEEVIYQRSPSMLDIVLKYRREKLSPSQVMDMAIRFIGTNSCDMLDVLLSHGPNDSGDVGSKLLVYAIHSNSTGCVRILLDHGGNPNYAYEYETYDRSDRITYPLLAAVKETRPSYRIVHLLLQHGADVNVRTHSNKGMTPVMIAAVNGHADIVRLLIDYGADLTIDDLDGRTIYDLPVPKSVSSILHRKSDSLFKKHVSRLEDIKIDVSI